MKVNAPPAERFADSSLSFDIWLASARQWVEHALDHTLPSPTTPPAGLHQAMRHASLGGGKRLRAILALAACHAAGGNPLDALRPALALEIFHAYTLVHDDLPCMDDDDLRRGQPATHIQFGEANALLAGDALLTLACQWMAESPVPPPHPPTALVSELTRAGGAQGVIGGQFEDLAAEHAPPDEQRLLYIHREKTARLIACACRLGALCAGAPHASVDRLGHFGLHVGLAFQIIDDLLDATQDTSTLGKPAGSDLHHEKLTTVRLWGLDKSRAEAAHHTHAAHDLLASFDGKPQRLAELASHLLDRRM